MNVSTVGVAPFATTVRVAPPPRGSDGAGVEPVVSRPVTTIRRAFSAPEGSLTTSVWPGTARSVAPAGVPPRNTSITVRAGARRIDMGRPPSGRSLPRSAVGPQRKSALSADREEAILEPERPGEREEDVQ